MAQIEHNIESCVILNKIHFFYMMSVLILQKEGQCLILWSEIVLVMSQWTDTKIS